MSEVVVRNYYVSPEEANRSIEWLESMSDVLRIDDDHKLWIRVDDYWCTSNIDEDDR